MREYQLDQDRLDAYKVAREAARHVAELLPGVRNGNAELVDQLRRACLSVCLNIAEGAGTWLPKEKARFYRTARGSATECAAVLDHLVDQGRTTEKNVADTRQLYARVVATLTKLCIGLETTERPPPPEHGHGPMNMPRTR